MRLRLFVIVGVEVRIFVGVGVLVLVGDVNRHRFRGVKDSGGLVGVDLRERAEELSR